MRLAAILAAALFAAFHPIPVQAQAAEPSAKANFSAQLIAGGVNATDPATAWLGVDVRLGPGWHTYWRSAGDAGAPPEFDWSASRNVAAATVEWPAPRRFSEAGIDTFGYAERVLFPVKMRLQDPSAPAHVSLKLVLYVCSTICTQNDVRLETDIPSATAGRMR
jgi:suppressor for copper-sensitivity B